MAAQAQQIYVGTSGWAYPSWKPRFYPATVAARKFLEHYAARLTSVEVNYTFRSIVRAEQLAGWLAATGPEFRFSFKAPATITHIRRLRDCAGLMAGFLATLRPVVRAGQQAAVLMQFPPNFRAGVAGKDKQPNQQALTALLKQSAPVLRKSRWRLAVEFRDASWFNEETYAALRRANAALCQAEYDEKPQNMAPPGIQTADFAYSRLRAASYTESRLSSLAAEFAHQSQAGPVFVYFKHQLAPTGPLRAVKLLKMLRQSPRK